jgi:hypothetical protein
MFCSSYGMEKFFCSLFFISIRHDMQEFEQELDARLLFVTIFSLCVCVCLPLHNCLLGKGGESDMGDVIVVIDF